MNEPPSVLQKILERKKEEVAALRQNGDPDRFRRESEKAPPTRGFLEALKRPGRVPIIAEVKKASPSLGALAPEADPARVAGMYESGGAAALSVLTDGPFFKGCLDDLETARRACSLPVLRKDFIIDPVQVYQSRAVGADAVLLIAAALDDVRLADLFRLATSLGLDALVEVHTAGELERVAPLNPPLIGINNRNLDTLEVSLDTGLALRPLAPAGSFVVGESGVSSLADVGKLRAGGFQAFLIGTALMKAPDPVAMLEAMSREEV